MLARGGITGPAPIFEGRKGFFQLISGPADVDVEAFGRRGVPFRIHQCGMKAYPAVVYAQTAIVAGVALAKEVGDLDRIAAIEIATTRRGFQQTGSDPEKWTPDTRDTADHSLPYITARAMFDGDITNDSYAPDKLHDPRILAFMRKITVQRGSCAPARAGAPRRRASPRSSPTGGASSRQVDDVPGFPGRPMSEPTSNGNSAATSASAGRRSGPTPSCRRCGRSSGRTICPRCSASSRCSRARKARWICAGDVPADVEIGGAALLALSR